MTLAELLTISYTYPDGFAALHFEATCGCLAAHRSCVGLLRLSAELLPAQS
jgi:hypothetical protein